MPRHLTREGKQGFCGSTLEFRLPRIGLRERTIQRGPLQGVVEPPENYALSRSFFWSETSLSSQKSWKVHAFVAHPRGSSISRLIVPVQRLVKDPTSRQFPISLCKNTQDSLRPRSVKVPVKLHPDELLEMAGHLDGTDVRGVPLRTNVIVLQNAARVEVMNKGLCLAACPGRLLGDAVVDDRVAEVVVRVEPVWVV